MTRKHTQQLQTSASQADTRTKDEIEHQAGHGGSYVIDYANGDGKPHLVERTEFARVSLKGEGVTKHVPAKPEQPAGGEQPAGDEQAAGA